MPVDVRLLFAGVNFIGAAATARARVAERAVLTNS